MRVVGSASATICIVGRRSLKLRSRPVSRSVIIDTYCTGSGRSSPSSCRSTATFAMPRSSGEIRKSTGSPGASTSSANVIAVTPNSSGTSRSTRRARYAPTGPQGSAGLPARQGPEEVAQRAHPARQHELPVDPPDHIGPDRQDVRGVRDDQLLDLIVQRLLRLPVRGEHDLLQELIHLWAAVPDDLRDPAGAHEVGLELGR